MIRKHSVTLHGHRTSLSLEDAFWAEMQSIARARGLPLAALLSDIDESRPPDANLSSAIRIYVLNWLKKSASETQGDN
jgi:predicted DNA-binding ribbon-helix-helix protein